MKCDEFRCCTEESNTQIIKIKYRGVAQPTAHGLGNARDRCRRQMKGAGVGAAVEKIEGKRKPDDFFGHRKQG